MGYTVLNESELFAEEGVIAIEYGEDEISHGIMLDGIEYLEDDYDDEPSYGSTIIITVCVVIALCLIVLGGWHFFSPKGEDTTSVSSSSSTYNSVWQSGQKRDYDDPVAIPTTSSSSISMQLWAPLKWQGLFGNMVPSRDQAKGHVDAQLSIEPVGNTSGPANLAKCEVATTGTLMRIGFYDFGTGSDVSHYTVVTYTRGGTSVPSECYSGRVLALPVDSFVPVR